MTAGLSSSKSSADQPEMLLYAVGLGSNAGERPAEAVLAEGRDRLLARSGGMELRWSSLYRSAPVDCAPGTPDFVNAVILFRSRLVPLEMLDLCQAIEVELGRPRDHGRNEPRTLDLDILVAGDLCLSSSRLVVPHPRLHLRAFVLVPLAEVKPDLVVPGMERDVESLLAALPGDTGVRRLRVGW